jgi:catechol 2,3-dioxygenase-like lactoylglutathione lyase family enzyme
VLPRLRSVDHIGITVPDIEQATAFFVDVLGCNMGFKRRPSTGDVW